MPLIQVSCHHSYVCVVLCRCSVWCRVVVVVRGRSIWAIERFRGQNTLVSRRVGKGSLTSSTTSYLSTPICRVSSGLPGSILPAHAVFQIPYRITRNKQTSRKSTRLDGMLYFSMRQEVEILAVQPYVEYKFAYVIAVKNGICCA